MKDYVIRATGASGQIRAFVGITTNMVEEARRLHETSKEIGRASCRERV